MEGLHWSAQFVVDVSELGQQFWVPIRCPVELGPDRLNQGHAPQAQVGELLAGRGERFVKLPEACELSAIDDANDAGLHAQP